jgi:hypothetical protein
MKNHLQIAGFVESFVFQSYILILFIVSTLPRWAIALVVGVTTHQSSENGSPENVYFIHAWIKVVVPSPDTLSWNVQSMIHLEIHSPMHLKWIQYKSSSKTMYKSRMGTTTLLGITILQLLRMHDDVSPSPPTSMDPRRIDIPSS